MTAPKKKPVNSRAKGQRGELELAKVLTDLGYPARRGQQFKGGAESPDVVCEALREKGYHLECKLTKDCKMFSPATLKEWDAQAEADAQAARLRPVVVHRWNGSRAWWVRVQPGGWWMPYWQPLEHWLHDLGIETGTALNPGDSQVLDHGRRGLT